jgi:hypothetical protein
MNSWKYPNLFRAPGTLLYSNEGVSLCLHKESHWRMEKIRVIRAVHSGHSAVQAVAAAHRAVFVAISLLMAACDERRPAVPDTTNAAPAATAPDSQVAWTVRPILNAPRYFVLSDWVNDATVWGLAGENPVDVDARTGAGTAWGVRASGARRSPDRSAMAWGDPSGIWIMIRGGRPRRLLTYASLPRVPAGDPTNDIHWAPNGRRLLTSWRDEGNVTYALVDTLNGTLEPIVTRLPGYGAPSAVHWLDDRRIVFTAPAIASKDGSTDYRESGWRADLAVHDLGLHTYEKVTDVPDGVFLHVADAFSDTVVAVRRSGGENLATFSLFDTRTWREGPTGLTRGSSIAVTRDGARVVVFRSDDIMSQVIIRSRRPGVPHGAPVLLPGRIRSVAWSPNGRALAVSAAAEEPIEGSSGDLSAEYRLFVIEP